MRQLIEDEGYQATIYEVEGIKRIFIVATKGDTKHYFTIWDMRQWDLNSYKRYLLTDHRDSIFDSTWIHFLFPIHLLKTPSGDRDDSNNRLPTQQIFATFDYIANYYTQTGKNDTEICRDTQTILFNTIRQRTIVMQFQETPDGNFIHRTTR